MYFDKEYYGFYFWMQGKELEKELKKHYKKIHRIRVFENTFCIWFLNNEDSISIPLDTMKFIYDYGKSIDRLVRVIDKEYLGRIKIAEE